MPANSPPAEASEVLDLNADAATVDSQLHARATAADEAEPVLAGALTGPSAGSAIERSDVEERGRSEGGKGEVVVDARGVDPTGGPAVELVAGGHEASEEQFNPGGDVESQEERSGGEITVHKSSGSEVVKEKSEITVERVNDTGNQEDDISLRSVQQKNKIGGGSSEPNGGEPSLEVDQVVTETSGMNLVLPEGSDVKVDDRAIHVHSHPTNDNAYSRDVVAPDLNSAIDVVRSVESENMCQQRGDIVMEDINPASEMHDENRQMVDEATEREGHALTWDSDPAAEIVSLPTSEAPAGQSSHCPIQIEVPSNLVVDMYQQTGEKHEDTNSGNGETANVGNDGAVDPKSVAKLQALDQSGVPEVAPIKAGDDTSQATMSDVSLIDEDEKIEAHMEDTLVNDDKSTKAKCVLTSDAGSVAGECLAESSQLDLNPPSVHKQDSSQVEVSACPFLSENQDAAVEYASPLLDENQNSQPILVAGQDVSLTTSANMEIEHEYTRPDIIPSEEAHTQGVNLNKKEDDGINPPSDVMEDDEVGEVDTVGDQNELDMPRHLEKGSVDTENNQRASYLLPQEDKSAFSISDIVWGKVKSHPWWPGQIFDPLDASDMALRHQKRDNFLVGYFGDKTFAWCEESKLRPFWAFFSQLENQSISDAFVNAVNSALLEVSRHVELGMSCICVPEEVISNRKHQKIENAGIREGACCSVLDKSFGVAAFEPRKFLDYIKALAQYPCGGTGRLELVVAKAQLMAFNRLKGHTELPASKGREGPLEHDVVISPSQGKRPRKSSGEHSYPTLTNEEMVISDLSAGKRKKAKDLVLHGQKHIPEHGRKQKSLSELMDDRKHSDLVNGDETIAEMKASEKSFTHSSGKKRKKDDSSHSYSGRSKKKRLDALGDLETKSPAPDRSFKVGECISRIASKLTGSPSIIKCNGENLKKAGTGKADPDSPLVFDVSPQTPEDSRRLRKGTLRNFSSPEEMLSQLCLAARDPMKGYSFLSAIVSFFTEVRELRDSGSVVDKSFERIKKKRGRKKKSESNGNAEKPPEKIKKKRGRKKKSESVNDAPEKIKKKRGRKKKSEAMNVSKTDVSADSTPDYMADSYWTDRVVCGTPEENPQSGRRKRKGELLMQSTAKKTKSQEVLPLSKMLEAAHHLRISAVSPTANRDSAVEKQATFFGEKCMEESTPTALILSFNEPGALPSETNLIRMFSRYGPLKEAETEILSETNCAKVVFKRRADAEVAFSSAGKYCIFGPALVSYRLRYLPSTPVASLEARSDGRKDTKAPDDVCLGGPEEAKGPAREDVKELAQEEVKGQAQEEVKGPAQEEVKGIAQEEVMVLAQEEVTGLAEEAQLIQVEAEEVAQDEGQEIVQEEVKELSRDEAQLSQAGGQVLAQKEANGLSQEDAKGPAQEEEKGPAQEEVKALSQEEAKGPAQEDVKEQAKEPAQEEVKEQAQDGANEPAQEVKEHCEHGANKPTQEEVKGLALEEAKEVTQGEAKE